MLKSVSLHKHSPVFRGFFITYFILACIPVLIMSVLFYQIYYKNSIGEIDQANLSSLTQVRSSFDYMIKDFSQSGLQYIAANTAVTYLNDESYITQCIVECENSLRTKANVFLFERGDRFIYLNRGRTLYSVFEGETTNPMNMNMSKFYSTLNETEHFLCHPVTSFEGNQSTQFLAFLFPSENPLQNHSTIGFLVSNSTLSDITNNYLGHLNGSLYLFDSDLTLLYSENESPDSDFIRTLHQYKGSGVFPMTETNGDLLLMRTVSDESGLIFCYVVPKESAYSQLSEIQNILSALATILIILGTCLAFSLAIFNYQPIRRLLQLSDEGTSIRNEFDRIGNALMKRQEENHVLSLQISEQLPIIYQQFFIKLLRGKFKSADELSAQMQLADIHFQYNGFFIIIFSSLTPREFDLLLEKQDEPFFFPEATGYPIQLFAENDFAVLFNVPFDSPTPNIRLERATEFLSFLKSHITQDIVLGVGGIYQDPMRVSSSYVEAYASLHLAPVSEKHDIFLYQPTDPDFVLQDKYLYPVNEFELYSQALRHANASVAKEALEKMMYNVLKQSPPHLLLKSLIFDVLNTSARILNSYGEALPTSKFMQAEQCYTIEECSLILETLTNETCEIILNCKNAETKKLKTDIIEFVNHSFTNPEMSLEYVAGQFDISVSFLTKFFKKETGESFNQYVILLRINKAKNLLRNTDLPIKDIVSEIGYIDIASFSRRFKNMVGVPPGEYRKHAHE